MALIEQDLSAESKTSAYDLYLSRPQQESNTILICAQVLEDIGKEVSGIKNYF